MQCAVPLIIAILYLSQAASSQHLWDKQRDDLSEYQLVKSASNVRSDIECAIVAEVQHHAVEFSQADGSCRMFICQLGWSGCRKCRNARNNSLPLLLVRRLDQLGHNCWRTFQHRVDGSVDFNRSWTNYLSPFGQGENLNYWMGLEAIHQLTQAGDRRVRWEISMWNGSMWWWENSFFAVQGADQGFRVSVGNQVIDRSSLIQCTNVGALMDNQKFSTYDNDQDPVNNKHCAVKFHSGWWHANCHCFNPNGLYVTPPTAFYLTAGSLWAIGISVLSANNVHPFNLDYSMKTFECMVTDYL